VGDGARNPLVAEFTAARTPFSVMSDTAQDLIAFGGTYRSSMTPYCYKD